MTPTFTVLIGSAGRDTLTQTLDSIARQRRVPGDQAIVAFDLFERDVAWYAEQAARVHAYGDGFVACGYDSGYHWLGVEQINFALRSEHVTGSHVFTLGDDDVFTDDAYATLRPLCTENPNRPILYKFVAPWRELLWDHPRMERSRISGCCIAAPVAAVGQMSTVQYVEHDYDWMLDILAHCRHEPLWLNRVLVIARPPARGDDVAHRGILQCWHCKNWRYLEDVSILKPKCPSCGVITDLPGRYNTVPPIARSAEQAGAKGPTHAAQ